MIHSLDLESQLKQANSLQCPENLSLFWPPLQLLLSVIPWKALQSSRKAQIPLDRYLVICQRLPADVGCHPVVDASDHNGANGLF